MEEESNVARYWIAFDLGFGADYEGLFVWLDKHKAYECTPNVATFTSRKTSEDLEEELKDILSDNKKARIYIVYPREGKYYGRWLLGRRKFSPWSGYHIAASEVDEDED